MRILLLDIETAPNTAHVWGLWQQNVSINQLRESSYVLCWAAKWLGEKDVMFSSVYAGPHKSMLRKIHALLDEADSVIHYNGTKFDIPTLNKEFIIHGMHQPSPYKQMDLLKVARNQFKFPSNKLDYVAHALGAGKKTKHIGHELWIKCMERDPKAWALMEKYNKNDVVLLEKVFDKLLPWMKNPINHNTFNDAEDLVCPNCGEDHYQNRGFAYTQAGKFSRHQCLECFSWFRGNVSEHPKRKERFVAL